MAFKRCHCGKVAVSQAGCAEHSRPRSNPAIRLLLWVGLVRRKPDGSIRWPVHVAPRHIWADWGHLKATARMSGPVYVFRNLPHVVKWEKGRLLPRRWGVGFFGLVEFGDRG